VNLNPKGTKLELKIFQGLFPVEVLKKLPGVYHTTKALPAKPFQRQLLTQIQKA